jgi:hypothetical protein
MPSAQASGKKPAAGATPPNPDKERIQTKLELCSALANMYQGNYDTAAYGFLKLKRDLSDWQGKVHSLFRSLFCSSVADATYARLSHLETSLSMVPSAHLRPCRVLQSRPPSLKVIRSDIIWNKSHTSESSLTHSWPAASKSSWNCWINIRFAMVYRHPAIGHTLTVVADPTYLRPPPL